MWGFGDPDTLGGTQAPPPSSVGFGHVDPGDGVSVAGFGSPSNVGVLAPERALGLVGSAAGGQVVTLSATWPIAGPWRIWLEAPDGQVFPPAPATGATAPMATSVFGQPQRLGDPEAAYASGRSLSFIIPPAPPGFYTVVAQAGSYGLRFVGALRLLPAPPCSMTYTLRTSFPPGAYDVGGLAPGRVALPGEAS